MSKIYIVYGEYSDYDAHSKWSVKAFLDKDKAESLKKELNNKLREVVKYLDRKPKQRYLKSRPSEEDLGRCPHLIEKGREFGYTFDNQLGEYYIHDTEYDIEEVELETGSVV